jgi:hypothetical protein
MLAYPKKNSLLLTSALVSHFSCMCTVFRTLPRALHSLQLRLPQSSQDYKVPVAVAHHSGQSMKQTSGFWHGTHSADKSCYTILCLLCLPPADAVHHWYFTCKIKLVSSSSSSSSSRCHRNLQQWTGAYWAKSRPFCNPKVIICDSQSETDIREFSETFMLKFKFLMLLFNFLGDVWLFVCITDKLLGYIH